ncbi:alpha/beta hydrolase [Rathayibacter sp. CAU 1779]
MPRAPRADRRLNPRRRRWIIPIAVAASAALVVAGVALSAPRAHSSSVRATTAAQADAGTARDAVASRTSGIGSFVAPGGIRTTRNVRYASAPDGTALDLDVCSPVTRGTDRPAILLIHGGGWARGDKGTTAYHAVCEWLAAEGFVTFSADYTLGEQGRFPVAPDELRKAIAWMRVPVTAVTYGFDPARIGLVGGSAGGSLASLLATEGSGPTDRGTRVAALVDLSGPVDLTARGQSLGHPGAGLQSLELAYLGCASFVNCQQASAASAITHVDSSDPPAFIQGSENDFVPHEQGQAFAAALQRAGVPATVRVVPGNRHSIAELDASSRAAIAAFLHRYLG